MRPRLLSGINRLRAAGCLEYEWRAVTLGPLLPQPSACFREDIGMRAGRCVDGRVAVIRHYNDYTQWQTPFAAASRTGDPSVNALPLLAGGTKSIGSKGSMYQHQWRRGLSGADFIMQQRRNVVTFPRLCRDGIGRSIFLHKGRNALG